MDAWLIPALQLAGLFQLGTAAANVPAARAVGYARNLAGTEPVFRQVFWAHVGWVVASLVLLGSLDLFFADVLAGGGRLGVYVSAWIAVLWGARLALQLAVYDRAFLRAHPVAHWTFSAGFLFTALVHAVAALRPLLGIGAV
jgi:hypothetical protein